MPWGIEGTQNVVRGVCHTVFGVLKALRMLCVGCATLSPGVLKAHRMLCVGCVPLCLSVLRTYPNVTEFNGKVRYQAIISNTAGTRSFPSEVKGTERETVNSLHSRIRGVMLPCPTYLKLA